MRLFKRDDIETVRLNENTSLYVFSLATERSERLNATNYIRTGYDTKKFGYEVRIVSGPIREEIGEFYLVSPVGREEQFVVHADGIEFPS